jgi:uncharacterized protein YndB with AHSA1/START domain
MKRETSIFIISIGLLFQCQKYQEVTEEDERVKTVKKEFVVKKSIRLKAHPSEVWDALTNPQKTRKYFFNCEVSSDWKVGSPITWTGTVLLVKRIQLHGQIVEVQHQKLLKYTLKNKRSEHDTTNFSTVTGKLTYDNGETTLSITDDVGLAEGAEERYKKSEKGWDKVLVGLKEIVEEEG